MLCWGQTLYRSPAGMPIPISWAWLSPFLIPRVTAKKVSQGRLAAPGTQETG